MSDNRTDFEDSTKRATRWQSNPKRTKQGAVKDFLWNTGRWCWLPKTIKERGYGWNEQGGTALHITHTRRYWLCMGWSTIEEES